MEKKNVSKMRKSTATEYMDKSTRWAVAIIVGISTLKM